MKGPEPFAKRYYMSISKKILISTDLSENRGTKSGSQSGQDYLSGRRKDYCEW